MTLRNPFTRVTLLAVFALNTVVLNCQIKYESLTLDEASKLARKENKIVMVIIESETCTQCNDVAEKGLSGNSVKKLVDREFIPIKYKKIPVEVIGVNMIITFPTKFFGIFFLDADKNLLFIKNSSSSDNKTYLQYFDTVLKEKDDTLNNLPSLKKKYYTSLNSHNSIINLEKKIRALELEPAQTVLDDLTQKAPLDSFLSVSFIKLVLDGAPIYSSSALTAINTNNDNYFVAWYQLPLSARQSINNRIRTKSLQKAIAEKNLNYVYIIANNGQDTYQNNNSSTNQQRNYKSLLLEYYKGVNDTINYIRNAITFYDEYFMKTKVEPILRSDSLQKEKSQAQFLTRSLSTDSNQQKSGTITRNITNFGSSAQYFSNELNNAAWTLYTYTSEFNNLKKALEWSKRSNEFYEGAEAMDTYARLLYKTGNKAEAVESEIKAITLRKLKVEKYEDYETVLKKMKNNEVKIDNDSPY